MLSELSLPEQAAVQQSFADAITAKYRALLTTLDPSPTRAATPWAAPGAGSNLFPTTEHLDMADRQYRHDMPLNACTCGKVPRMWQATGNRQVLYFVECSPCRVRTPKVAAPDSAAAQWSLGIVAPITATAATAQAVA